MRKNAGKIACLVDAYSTGAELAKALYKLGWRLVHVQSGLTIPAAFKKTYDCDLFETNLIAAALSRSQLFSLLDNFKPAFVVAGSEPGVELADWISAALQLAGNDPHTSYLRRNKYAMSERLTQVGLDAVSQYQVTSRAQLLSALACLKVYPVVVKPVDSMGSENVRVCYDECEALEAFDNIFGKENFVGNINNSVLVQEFLEGDQYLVNAVSIEGRHRVSEIWHEKRLNVRGVGNLYDYETILPYEGSVQGKLITYVTCVLDALGVRNGASHSEIIVTSRGPVLIETGARMQGGIVSKPIIEALGYSHMTLTLNRYIDPSRFFREINIEYRLNNFVRVVNLISEKSGVVVENNSRTLLATLPSFYLIARTPEVGDLIPKTVDLSSKAGHIYLMHNNMDQLDKDYAQIRTWEEERKLISLS
jgi:L-amino acid ligase